MTDNTLILYTTADGQSQFVLRELGGQLWLTQLEIAKLYQTSKQNISKHISAVLAEGELSEAATVNFQLTVQTEGGRQVSREIAHYSLPMIIAVGYRVRSSRGTQFRQWATRTLGEYLQKGFVLDDERLKNPPVGTAPVPDYFDELLERIRDIRASERRVYLRVREIFALAADYQPSFKETTQFFTTMQNKLHFACIGHTAAELIYRRADASKPLMGLTHTTGGAVRKKDIKTAKNYLNEAEISQLNRIVTMWLDFAEDQAQRKKQVFLKDWTEKLNQFLAFNDREVLQGADKISKNRLMPKQKPNTNAIWQHKGKSKSSAAKRILPNCCACKPKSPNSLLPFYHKTPTKYCYCLLYPEQENKWSQNSPKRKKWWHSCKPTRNKNLPPAKLRNILRHTIRLITDIKNPNLQMKSSLCSKW